MADTIWPGTLPQDVLLDGYSYQPGNSLAATDMDVGPPKVRRRSTSAPAAEQWAMVLTYAQKVEFEAFFAEQLAQGALTFEFGEPGAPIYDPGYLLTEDGGSYLTMEDGTPILLDHPWQATRTYRFDPRQSPPWSLTALGAGLYKLTCSVLRLA